MNNELAVEHVFKVENRGDAPLNLNRIRSSCGCTVAHVSTNLIAPGADAELRMTFNLRGRSGRQRKWITIESNDPVTPHLRLEMTGVASAKMTIEPRSLHFGTRTEGEELERSLTITASQGENFRVTAWDLGSDQYQGRLQTNRPGTEYLFSVKPVATNMGRHSALAQIRTDNPAFSLISIPVSDTLASDFVVTPQKIVLLVSEKKTFHARAVTIGSRSGRPFALVEALMPAPGCRHRIERVEAAKWRIIIEHMPLDSIQPGATIRLVTGMPASDPIVIPIEFLDDTKSSKGATP